MLDEQGLSKEHSNGQDFHCQLQVGISYQTLWDGK